MSERVIDPGNEVNVNPAKTRVTDILVRIERDKGYGIRPNEVLKLAGFTERCLTLISKRRIGWTVDERRDFADILERL